MNPAPSSYDLVIFDCDGVLIDSEPIANRVFAKQLSTLGLALSTDEVMRRFVGRTRDGCLAMAVEILGRDLPEDFAAGWDTALFAALGNEVRAIDGIPELIGRIGLPFCVASNSTHHRVRVSLEAAGLLALFEGKMFSSEDVAKPKPAPDLFLHAARTMGASPSRCVVIEDTPTGVRAAVAAGMQVFGFAGGAHSDPAALRAEGATVFSDMQSLAALFAA